jgi:hypothetical protein
MNLADMNTFYADFDLILKKKERTIVKILLSVTAMPESGLRSQIEVNCRIRILCRIETNADPETLACTEH